MAMSILNVIDEKGNIIGQYTRENIHKNGLLHKEVHTFFYTPQKEINFQLRDKYKDTFPSLLDATVGGHVELGSDYIDTALKEMDEETGVIAIENDLRLIKLIRKQARDEKTKTTNNVVRAVYVYRFDDNVSVLKIEKGAAQGFEKWPITKLIGNLSKIESTRFIPTVLDEEYLEIYRKIEQIY
jgi:isopentenyldiphosphate isomerase